jgi:hypothetical protein
MRLMSITSFGSDDLFYSCISFKVRAFIERDLPKICGNTPGNGKGALLSKAPLVVEKVKKRELSYKKRRGNCAESEAVDFKIVL